MTCIGARPWIRHTRPRHAANRQPFPPHHTSRREARVPESVYVKTPIGRRSRCSTWWSLPVLCLLLAREPVRRLVQEKAGCWLPPCLVRNVASS